MLLDATTFLLCVKLNISPGAEKINVTQKRYREEGNVITSNTKVLKTYHFNTNNKYYNLEMLYWLLILHPLHGLGYLKREDEPEEAVQNKEYDQRQLVQKNETDF